MTEDVAPFLVSSCSPSLEANYEARNVRIARAIPVDDQLSLMSFILCCLSNGFVFVTSQNTRRDQYVAGLHLSSVGARCQFRIIPCGVGGCIARGVSKTSSVNLWAPL